MKKLGLKRAYIYFSTFFIFILHLPMVFAKAKTVGKDFSSARATTPSTVTKDTRVSKADSLMTVVSGIYDSLRLNSLGLTRQVFDYAYQGFSYLKEVGKVSNDHILSIIDFSKSSAQKRLFIIDLKSMKVLYNTYVAHGVNSGEEYASQFSNSIESNESSLGFYETANTYLGKNGYSLRLEGLESGFNDNAYEREIVMHGASYVNEKLIRARGYIGRSWGCPAVPQRLHKFIINKIKNGTCLFIYSPDRNYIAHSGILKQMAYSPVMAYNYNK
jgi:hypothetical protein